MAERRIWNGPVVNPSCKPFRQPGRITPFSLYASVSMPSHFHLLINVDATAASILKCASEPCPSTSPLRGVACPERSRRGPRTNGRRPLGFMHGVSVDTALQCRAWQDYPLGQSGRARRRYDRPQILGFIAFVQVMLAVYGIVELRRAAGLFKA